MADIESPSISRRLDLIAQKLDALIRLQVIGMTQGKSQTDQIWLYSTAGLQPREIAEQLGTTPNTVRVILFNLRKSRRQRLRQ
jgi:DNA-binding NarL/FixJ family response regulator